MFFIFKTKRCEYKKYSTSFVFYDSDMQIFQDNYKIKIK